MDIDEAIEDFSVLLTILEKTKQARHHIKFNMAGDNLIHIWDAEGKDIVRITDEDMLDCYTRAISEIERYIRRSINGTANR